MREPKESNDLFYLCSLIEEICRQSKNTKADIIDTMGIDTIKHIYDFADVYHCEQINYTAEDFIEQCKIKVGTTDTVGNLRYRVPSVWEIGRVYSTLIEGVAKAKSIPIIDALEEVYHSFLCPIIDDFDGSLYYEIPDNILLYYLEGRVSSECGIDDPKILELIKSEKA